MTHQIFECLFCVRCWGYHEADKVSCLFGACIQWVETPTTSLHSLPSLLSTPSLGRKCWSPPALWWTTCETGLQLGGYHRERSYQRFTDCYKRFYQLQPEITQRIYDKFIAQLQTSIREEISDIKEEGNLEAVLNALDKIVEEGKDRKEPAWRPSGIPEKDLHSVMAPYFLQQRDTLWRHVQKQEAENQQLADAVLAGRRQVEELQLQVQARQQAWQALHREQRELVAVLREPE
ncbi:PREDICTED: polyamine-modulated factor 1 isoform X2 [Rhinopithecus bieti]|uniref:polyamine-modulated factor 1 isoform X2 n=1 Tax=Rhinopithecus bieti TaxID=61621 RepID=UPI00083BC1B7|nr:PREDICTED: polyamine-modulated factor 1 isoform X2 [Rhinopithecus bieti]